LAKINKSIRSGAGENDIYKPTLWYFDILDFLNDQEKVRKSKNTIDDDDENAVCEEIGQEVSEIVLLLFKKI
jgi:hypothetical protein